MNNVKMPNTPPKGFKDVFGRPAWMENVVSQALVNWHHLRGYKLLRVPVIERVTSFSKDVVGSSPWPEWNIKNCICLKLENYDRDYKTVDYLDVLLIPEATVSVARWLSTYVEKEGHNIFPLKIMYYCPCFRNENIESLIDNYKLRQFDQFGIEILGTSSEYADIETILLIVEGLEHVGIARNNILVRIGDIRLLKSLAKRTRLNEATTLFCKQIMDRIAETRAKGEKVEKLKKMLYEKIYVRSIPFDVKKAWEDLADTATSYKNIHKLSALLDNSIISNLKKLSSHLDSLNVSSILDLAVVRSHEYYNSLVMEVDIHNKGINVVEIAGGGRYNRLVSPFLPKESRPIPAVGYAYGLQRICGILSKMGKDIRIEFNVRLKPAEKVVIPQSGDPVKDFKLANKYAREGKQADVYVGDFNSNLRDYVRANKAILA